MIELLIVLQYSKSLRDRAAHNITCIVELTTKEEKKERTTESLGALALDVIAVHELLAESGSVGRISQSLSSKAAHKLSARLQSNSAILSPD